MNELNYTHNPQARSWVTSANVAGADFPIQNLPFAVLRPRGESVYRVGVAIGDQIVDLAALGKTNLVAGEAKQALAGCAGDSLNELMAMDSEAWSALRCALFDLLVSEAESAIQVALKAMLVAQAEVEYKLPCQVGDYTDFYTSIHHATRVGELFRPDNPLLPNYQWIPIGYHGRASSLNVSGGDFKRPLGQLKAADDASPQLLPCKRLDYELEVAIYLGTGNQQGEPIALDSADRHVFGLGLLNDWSSRDVQAWEYQPLGPFLSKSFASTLSPWIVTNQALAPYRCAWDVAGRSPLGYLDSPAVRESGGYDLQLEVWLETELMRQAATGPQKLSSSNFNDAYWTVAHMVAHHTINGCNLKPGDLFGSGTQSGPAREMSGSLLELSYGGKQPIQLANGEQRTFLEDGDRVILRGFCERAGAARIGLGEVSATVLAADG